MPAVWTRSCFGCCAHAQSGCLLARLRGASSGSWQACDWRSVMRSLWPSTTRRALSSRLLHGLSVSVAAVILVVLVQAGAAKPTLAGTWSSTASMSTVRYAHTATLLRNGEVLVAGGYDASNTPLASAELFHPATGQWTPTGYMGVARVSATATLLPNGEVLASGGADASHPRKDQPAVDGQHGHAAHDEHAPEELAA